MSLISRFDSAETQFEFVLRAAFCPVFLADKVAGFLWEFIHDVKIYHGMVIILKGDADEPFIFMAGDFSGVGFGVRLHPGVVEGPLVVTAAPAGGGIGYLDKAEFVCFLPLALHQFFRVSEPAGQHEYQAADKGKDDEQKDKANPGHTYGIVTDSARFAIVECQ